MADLMKIIVLATVFCPHCGHRHVDEMRDGERWDRRAHTTHRCQNPDCGQDFDVFVSGTAGRNLPPIIPRTRMKVRKWRLEHHPTVAAIPISIIQNMSTNEYVPLLKHAEFYAAAVALVEEHNALVDEIGRLKKDAT